MRLVHSISNVILSIIFCATTIVGAGTIKGKVTVHGARDARDVVVYIDSVSGEFAPPKEHQEIDQKNLTFVPHVLPILVGTTVDFLNSDDVMHNVFSPDKCADKINLGSWPKGETRSHTFNTVDCQAVILCNVHPEMEGWVVVLQNPYFFKTDKDGVYTIENVPAGKYTLKVWNEKLKGESQEVTVPEKGEVTVDFTMKR
jgi:plastocyanin